MQTAVIGAVEYRISREEPSVIDARYLSTGSMAQQAGTVCRGKARGDTANGFPGDYHIQYFGTAGELLGDFDWHIEPVGESYCLVWRNRPENTRIPVEAGEVVFEGFGFPNGEDTIVVAYWMTDAASAAMRSK